MNRYRWISCTVLFASLGISASAGVDTGEFSYQGQLKQNGVPVTDVCDFAFSLWSDEIGSLPVNQVGEILLFDGVGNNEPSVEVFSGLFSVVLDFGPMAFTDDPRWLQTSVRCPAGVGGFSTLQPRELVTGAPYSIHTRGIFVDDVGRVGIGTASPEPPLHVAGNGTFRGNHVAYFHSQSGPSSDGIAIQLDNASTNRDNNFITFYNGNEMVTGRIEGFDLENGDWITPPPLPDLNVVFDPGIRINDPRDWLDEGALPTATLTPGTLPTLNFTPGTLPTANFTPGTLPSLTFTAGSLPTANFTPGTLPSLTFSGGSLPSLSFSQGTLPSLTFAPGTNPSLVFNRGSLPSLTTTTTTLLGVDVVTGFTFNTGSLPSATFSTGTLPSATFSSGTLPTANFTPGTLPTANFTPGTLPSLSFTAGSLPTANLTPGTLPSLSFSGGSLPTLSFTPGTLPSLSFNGGRLPRIIGDPITVGRFELSFDIPTESDIEALICWAQEQGVTDFTALDPVNAAMQGLKEAVAAKCRDEGVTYGSKGADYAEYLPKLNPTDRFQLGQIVGVKGGKVSLNTEDAEQIMAVSYAPVVLGNVPPEAKRHNYVAVGFMGQLPVVVRGKARAGDYIVPSGKGDGTAIAVAPENLQLRHLGRTLGRAWSDSENDIYSLINVVIGLPGAEARVILERHEIARSELVAENARLAEQVDTLRTEMRELAVMMRTWEERLAADGDCVRTKIQEASNR